MFKVNGSAPIRLADALSQLPKRTAASIAPKPIACRRQKFNAIASTNPANLISKSVTRRPRNLAVGYGSFIMKVTMKTDYVFLCGVMWTQFGLEDAGRELVRALHSDDPDIAVLASALLESTSQQSGRIQ